MTIRNCVRVGGWKALSPLDVIEKKRKTDQLIHTRRPFFSTAFFDEYKRFMSACFQTFGGHGTDARIKTQLSSGRR